MDQCSKGHKRCLGQRQIPWYPTRLLYLDPGTSAIRLIITNDNPPDGPYMTLSHRWGTTKYTKLTSKTLEDFKNRIDATSLPRCFQDAIEGTRYLGIKYLWIDSLCIQQDEDKQDWNLESRLMGKVYSHSFLNVSATLAEDDSRGLHAQQDLHPFGPTRFDLHVRAKRRFFKVGAPSERFYRAGVSLRKNWIVDNDMWDEDVEDAPLQSRGWVFQERFLASRVLHFTPRQMAWECLELSALETFPIKLPAGMMSADKGDIFNQAMSRITTDQTNDISFLQVWQGIVQQYTQTEFTFSRDKLVAFSGAAKEIESARNDTYLAGMWKSTFIYDLAWSRTRSDSMENPLQSSLGRAPTWSWMSTDGEVLYPDPVKIRKRLARVVEFPKPVLAGSSVTVAHGAVQLQGLLVRINSVEWEDYTISKFTVGGFCLEDGFNSNESHLDLEGTKDEVIAGINDGIFLVPLFATDEHMHALAVSLIKNVATLKVAFRRVGACQIQYRKLHIPQGNSAFKGGWIPDPSTMFSKKQPSYNLLHPIARGLIKQIETSLLTTQQQSIEIY